jgi:DNA-binding response OmpR family regulator
MALRIALLEDDEDQALLIKAWLEANGHRCLAFPSAKEIQRALQRDSFDLLILDWLLPESSGIEVLQWARNNLDWRVPVIFITGKDRDEDVIYALEQGADDFVSKPVSKGVVSARVAAMERRVYGERAAKEVLTVGDYEIDPQNGTVKHKGEVVSLTDREVKLAILLFSNLGRLLSRDYLLETVWGISPDVVTRTADTHISRLRQKLELYPENGWQLKAIYQHGYRLEQLEASEVLSNEG